MSDQPEPGFVTVLALHLKCAVCQVESTYGLPCEWASVVCLCGSTTFMLDVGTIHLKRGRAADA
jgi:hypothetical protein